MQQLVRFLIVYTAIITTLLLVTTFILVKSSMEQDKSANAKMDSFKQELRKVVEGYESQKEITREMDSLKQKIAVKEEDQISPSKEEVLGSDSSGFITINDKKWQTVEVYESSSYSSKVIGKIEFDKVYSYLKKISSWYQINLPNSQLTGWVAGRFLKEVVDNGPK